ncbi:MAG TPA: hypothetical protein VMY88_01345 [Acidimicrobiales bacterium]|nr:hypothetical protein [Acidimicrobiales bacterium]
MKARFLTVGALALLLTAVATGGVASARPQEPMRVTPQEPAEADFGAMGPGAPSGEALSNRPIDCDGPEAVYCDLIPIEIVPPTGMQDDRDIFFTIIELHWDDASGNNLDLSFWDNGQSTGTQEQLGSAASTRNPEIVRITNADLEQYNIVVVNSGGANTGYKIKARISMEPFTSPTEAVAPDPPKQEEPEAEEPEEEITTPEDLSGDDGPPAVVADPTLPPVSGVGGDSDFGFGFSDLDSRITVQQDDFAAGSNEIVIKNAENVSPAVLLASLVGAPALVVGSGAAFAWKRRRDLLI